MGFFKRLRSGQTPPISVIFLLVGFIVIAFSFIGFRQLRGAQERRLRLLASFGERVESTVADLADRFGRIMAVPEEGPQRDEEGVKRYLDHVPHVSFIKSFTTASVCRDDSASGEAAGGSVSLSTARSHPRLLYCPRAQPRPADGSRAGVEAATGGEIPADGGGGGGSDSEPAFRGYLARIELQGLIEPMIIPGVFDSVLLADRTGEVLFQQGEPELRMLDLGALIPSSEAGEKSGGLSSLRVLLESGSDSEAVARLLPEGEGERERLSLGTRTAMVQVEIAGSDYYAFLQPVSPRFEPPPGHEGGRAPQWIACGIISAEHLLSAGLTTSPFLLFVLVSVLPLAAITWPFLKLGLITRRQRFSRLDLASLFLATVLGIALTALLVFDLLALARLHGNLDQQLESLAGALAGQFRSEVLTARRQLAALNAASEELLPEEQLPGCSGETGEVCPGSPSGATNPPANLGDLAPVTYIRCHEDRPNQRASSSFIQSRIGALIGDGSVARSSGIDLSIYPYFDSVFWATPEGDHGCANLPLIEEAVLPQNVKDRGYVLCARDCEPEPYLLRAEDGGQPAPNMAAWEEAGCGQSLLSRASEGAVPVCLQSILDRTTGESVAVLALPGPSKDFPVAAMVARLTSVGHPVLPPGFGFAIVERGGRVLFHSEARRDLTENFLKASDEDPLLRSLLAERREGHLSLHYWGRPTRIYLKQLEGLPSWSLVTFRDTYDLRVRNFELVYDFLNPFLLYFGSILLVAAAGWAFLARGLRRFLWPSAEHLAGYRAIVLTTPFIVAGFGAALLSGRPGWILIASVSALPVAVALAFLIWWVPSLVRRRRWKLRPVTANPAGGGGPLARARKAWERKSRWYPGLFLPFLAVAGSFVFLWRDTRVMAALLALLMVGLMAVVAWHWQSFRGERRKIAFMLALGCVLVVSALLPALGFFSLARSRQAQLHTQEAQVALARRLEKRDAEIESRQGPLDFLYRDFGGQLEEHRDAYLGAVFETRVLDEADPLEGLPEPRWPFGLRAAGSPGSSVARLLAARPFPLNDLSARPVESDLTRFADSEVEWGRRADGRLVLGFSTQGGTGKEIYLASTAPRLGLLGDVSRLRRGLLVLGLLLLGASPFLLARYLARSVFLVSLVGEPSSLRKRRRKIGTPVSPSSKPLAIILDGIRRTEDLVRQVVLVSTLPGPSAWEYQVAEEDGPELPEDAPPLFHQVSFREAWRRARNGPEPAAQLAGGEAAEADSEDVAGTEMEQGGTGEDVQAGADRADRFYEELVPPSRGGGAGKESSQPQPVLLTQFAPALDDPAAAAAQVAALQRLSIGDGRSVVIVTESVPDPELRAKPDTGNLKARRSWTELLASYSVEYGYDTRTYDLERMVSELDGRVEALFKASDLPAGVREDLDAIRGNARMVIRECSPTPVLRSIGWSLLLEIGDALSEVEEELSGVSDHPSSELETEVESALRALVGASRPDADEEARLTSRLVEALVTAQEGDPNPAGLVARAARSIAGGRGRAGDLLARMGEALGSATTADGDGRRAAAVELLDRARRGLQVERRRRRTHGLLQLITRDYVVAKVGAEARLHYRYLWSRCTDDEKLVLVQLEKDGLVNPKYFGWVMDLMNRGLVMRDPRLRLINESFGRFVHQEVQRSQILEWQEQEGPSAWSVLKWLLPAPLVLVAVFLFVTQRDALSNVTGVVVALVSLAPILINLYGQFQQVNARRETKTTPDQAGGSQSNGQAGSGSGEGES